MWIKGEAYEKDEMIYGICTVGGYDADLGEYAGSARLGTGYRQGDILFNMECCKKYCG